MTRGQNRAEGGHTGVFDLGISTITLSTIKDGGTQAWRTPEPEGKGNDLNLGSDGQSSIPAQETCNLSLRWFG